MKNENNIKKEELSNKDFFDQILEEDKKVNPENPCDPSSPNYPWEPCGLNNKDK
ncbi:hypothetical protein [Clostridium chrysemydis]|uniref:hypothetical protein n=1 Tax=Clostridium chrysemydis TaxID=2665504 RepID=UPI0018847085|nr:hypothetical protein [Clostridium chrysemydis]